MAQGPQARLLADGRRLHLQHGPIDLIIEAFGPKAEVAQATIQARCRFEDVLEVLVSELPLLRAPIKMPRPRPDGPVARRMVTATWPHRGRFLTPMAAVAGSVADEVLAAMVEGRALFRAYVNNGGDIAFHLAPGTHLSAGLVGDLDIPAIEGLATFHASMPVRGIATSGWKGRSFSLGIADSVTVCAGDAAAADVAATLIANALDAEHPAIGRRPANEISDDTDLGDRLVTVAVGDLDKETIGRALEAGRAEAERMRRAGLIHAAVLVLGQEIRLVEDSPAGLIAIQAA